MNKTVFISGSNGLVGAEAALYYGARGYRVVGLDNNMRAEFFGKSGDTTSELEEISSSIPDFELYCHDVRDRRLISEIFSKERPNLVIHCAAQPSHDLAKELPYEDFDVNAVGTLNVLEASRQFTREAPFVFISTNKVYGDLPNAVPVKEFNTRYDYLLEEDYYGIDESLGIDLCLHSPFGASKLAADILTQEYGRYYGMPTVCFRAGCITGKRHKGVQLHGFLSYLATTIAHDQSYKIFGYNGKQVRDQIHSSDLVQAIDCFVRSPRCAEVYNIGGGRDSNASVLESITMLENQFDKKLDWELISEPRVGDHRCYISDTRKFKSHYPEWVLSMRIENIVAEFHKALCVDR